MKLKDCKKGMRVKYVPSYVNKDKDHPGCESGVISSVGKYFVFVKYDNGQQKMVTGDEPYTSAATDPQELTEISE